MRGINLGGWLVIEKWITPGLFRGVEGNAERDIIRELGEAGVSRIRRHRKNFIMKRDVRWLADHGYELLRVPVGYWYFGDSQGFTEGEGELDKVIHWADEYGLRVVIDLHGLPGSQNGKHHSGQSGSIRFYEPKNRKRALSLVEQLLERYGTSKTVWGIQIINEPSLGIHTFALLDYYKRAATMAERYDTHLIVGDGFAPKLMDWLLGVSGLRDKVVLDVHWYHIFGKRERSMSFEEHEDLIAERSKLMSRMQSRIIVGEWSRVMPKPIEDWQKLGEIQESEYERSSLAHCIWTYKTDEGGRWSIRS